VRIAGNEWDDGKVLHVTLGHGIEPEEAEEVFAASPVYRKPSGDITRRADRRAPVGSW